VFFFRFADLLSRRELIRDFPSLVATDHNGNNNDECCKVIVYKRDNQNEKVLDEVSNDGFFACVVF
jgi:hypothetical protein